MESKLSIVSLVISVIAIAAAGTTLFTVQNRKVAAAETRVSDTNRAAETKDPLGKGLKHYDFATPRSAYESSLKIWLEGDLRALIELSALTEHKAAREQLQTLEVRREAEWHGTKILFLSYEREGVKKFETVGFEKHADTGFWMRHDVSDWDFGKDDKDLADQIKAWRKNGSFK